MSATEQVYSSGKVAERVGLTRPRLLYLVECGAIPGPTYTIPGRRLFTEADVRQIESVLAARPELRVATPPTNR
jgi:DNA-binding transcriptional MerR regulator